MKPLQCFIRCVTLWSAILLAGIVFLPQQAAAKLGEGLQIVEGEALHLKAESVMHLGESRLFIAEGNVEIIYRTTRLTADRVEIHEVTGEAVAIGNVEYREDGDTVVADRLELNIDTEKGSIYSGEVALEEEHYITGLKIDKVGKDTYHITTGSYTACNSPNPAWLFRCSRAKVQQGEYLQAWHTIGYVKGIPVFYFPYFIFPIKNQRQTGFLVPEVGGSTSNGFILSNAFFWAISPSQDATLRHTYYEERGNKFDLEYRYIYSKETRGNAEGQYSRDTKEQIQDTRFEWEHQHGLPYGIKGRIDLNLTSNDRFDENFKTKFEDRTTRKLKSDISLTKNFSRHSIRLVFNRLDDLQEESSNRIDLRFPELHITTQQQQMFKTPLYFQQQTRISHLKREGKEGENLEFSRIDIHPSLSIPLNLLDKALTINPRIEFRETYYTRDATTATNHNLSAEPVHREYYTFSVGVSGPKFNRIFDLGRTRRIQKIKHLIEPTVRFEYRPALKSLNVPKFDGIDIPGETQRSRSLNYGITQRLLAKQVEKDAWESFLNDNEEEVVALEDLSTKVKELASFSIYQRYDFEDERRRFSDIEARLAAEPFENYRLSLNTRYDVYLKTFVRTDVDLRGQFGDFLDFGARWDRTATVVYDKNTKRDEITDVRRSLNVNASLTLFKDAGLSFQRPPNIEDPERITFTYRGRFNIEERERIEDSFTFTYDAQCWNVSASYSQQLIKDKRDKSFRVILELMHLGKLFDIKG